MAEKSKQNKRQPKKLNAAQMTNLFGPRVKPAAPVATRVQHHRPRPTPKAKQADKSRPETAQKPAQKPALTADPGEWAQHFARIAQHSQNLLTSFAQKQQESSSPLLPASVIGSFV